MENSEEQLAAEIAKIQALGKDNSQIDTTAMITRLLEQHQSSKVPTKLRIRAFLISVLFPPFGLYYVIKFYLRPERDARRLAVICLLLTIGAFIFLWAIASIILAPFAGQFEQIQNINLKEIQELTQ